MLTIFKVVVPVVRIRSAPHLSEDVVLTGQQLQYGERVEVDPHSRTVADGYVWWEHSRGWSASERTNRSETLMILLTQTEADGEKAAELPVTAKIQFRVITSGLRIRTTPATGKQNLIGGKYLQLGQTVEVDANSRTSADGFVWWEHEQGWSAQGSEDGLQVFMEVIEDVVPEDSEIPPSTLLEVPWVSQLDPETAPGSYDCGQACVLMVLRYYGKVTSDVTVKSLTDIEYGKTTDEELKQLAARSEFDLQLDLMSLQQTISSMASLRQPISQGKPVILLVNYQDLGFINHLNSGTNQGLHWIVVTGYAGDTFTINDPLWLAWQNNGQGGTGGGGLKIGIDTLTQAARPDSAKALV